jgi:site-specific recombinase XerD
VTRRPARGVESQATNGPATPESPGPGIKEATPDATATLLTAEALAFAARVRQAERGLVKNKAYRSTPIGQEVGRFLRAMRWAGHPQGTLDTYEFPLARLAYDLAHLSLEEVTTEHVRSVLDEHWGELAPATRANRLSAIKSFFEWAVEERGLGENPAARIKPPKKKHVERHAYRPDVIEQLRRGQPSLRDQIGVQLPGVLAFRRNELRLLQIKDFDLTRNEVLIHGKGGKVVVLPIGQPDLISDLHLHLIDRKPDEYFLYPRNDRSRPMSSAAVHRWFKKCLERAGLPTSIQMHELRHSAADNLLRATGNVVLAQQLLRHESLATTQLYLHPNREDLADALASLPKRLRSETEGMA